MTLKKKDGWIKYDMSDPKQKIEVEKKIKENIDKKYGNKKDKSKKVSKKTKEEIASDLIKKIPPPEEKNTPPKGPGRPDKITSTILHKLKTCFAVGMTDEEACYFCQIGKSTLYKYQEENPEFTEEKDILKKSITLQAKFNVGRAIKKDENKDGGGTYNSWKRLQNKDPEFKGIGSPENPINLSLTNESQKLIDGLALG